MKNLLSLLAISFITGCSLFRPDPIVVPEPTIEERVVTIKEHPAPLNLLEVQFRVITEKNLEEFLKDNKEYYGQTVFIALTVPGYENLSLNLEEIKRYIKQQKAIILYYEERVVNEQEEPETPTEDR